jgi:hypothetical protein
VKPVFKQKPKSKKVQEFFKAVCAGDIESVKQYLQN